MANITYDPILQIQELARFRMLAPPAPPRPGTALVLEARPGRPVVVWPGHPIPDARLGNYSRLYVVNVEHYTVRLEELLPSSDPAFSIQCALTFHCGVRDPGLIAFRGIRDATAAMRVPLVRILRNVARQYDIGRINEAETSIEHELRSYGGDAAFATGGYLVELSSNSGYHDVTRDLRLDQMRRGAMQPVVEAGQDAIRAEWLANQGGDVMELLTLDARSEAVKVEQALAAARIQAGDDSEDFDTKQLRQQLLGQALGGRDALTESGSDRPGSRRRRIAGQLEASGDNNQSGRPQSRVRWKAERLDAEPPAAPDGDQGKRRDEPVPQASRIRGNGAGPAGREARAPQDPDADGG